MQNSPDVIAVVPEVELTTDERSDPEGRPADIWKAVDLCPFDEQAFEDVTVLPGECGWSARGNSGLERVWATVTETILPVADGTRRNTQELAEFLGAMRLSLVQLEKAQSTFFELRSGQVGWQPTVSHPAILLSFTSAEINNTVDLRVISMEAQQLTLQDFPALGGGKGVLSNKRCVQKASSPQRIASLSALRPILT